MYNKQSLLKKEAQKWFRLEDNFLIDYFYLDKEYVSDKYSSKVYQIYGLIAFLFCDKKAVYTPESKLERIIHTDRFTAGIDKHEFAYDYNYDITEDDNYYEPEY